MTSKDYLDLGYAQELSLFQPSPIDTGVQKTRWIPHKPVSHMERSLEFVITNNSSAYIDMARSTLQLQVQLLKYDGGNIPKVPEGGAQIPGGVDVGPVNLFHSSLFQQIDVYVQNKLVSASSNNYPFKAMFDVLLSENYGEKSSFLQSQMFYKDTSIAMDDAQVWTGLNSGLKFRGELTQNSRIIDLEGPLYTDISKLSRFLLNNVDLKFVLWTSPPSFHLMSNANMQTIKGFQTKIISATLNVCYVYVAPHILISHSKVLDEGFKAIYPYSRSEIKRFVVPQGNYSFSADDIFLSQVPRQVIVAMVSAQSVAGKFDLNPFNFRHFFTKYITLELNGESIPSSKPLTPRFTENPNDGNYMQAYLTLRKFKGLGPDGGNDISRFDYAAGYTLFVFSLDEINSNDPTEVKTYTQKGSVRCEILFEKPLEESINVFFYAIYNSELRFDKARGVEVVM